MKGRDQLRDLGVDGSIILKRILKKYKIFDWFHVAQYRDHWWTLVNTVMKFRVP